MKKKDNGKNILIISLVVIIVLLLGVVYYLVFYGKKPNNNIPETKIEGQVADPNKSLTEENTSNYTHELIVYYDENEEYFCWYDEIEDCGKKTISIKTETENAEKIYEYKDKYIFYEDNEKLKVYDNTTKLSYLINFDSKIKFIDFEVDLETNNFAGIIYKNNEDENDTFYSIALNKDLYKEKYRELTFLSEKYLSAKESQCQRDEDGFLDCKELKAYLLSATEEKELLSAVPEEDSEGYYEDISYQILYNDKAIFFTLGEFIDSAVYNYVYTEDLKVVAKNTNEFECSLGKDGNLYVSKKGIVSSYDKTGKLVKTSKKYDVQQLIGEYIVAFKNKNLILATIDGKEIVMTAWNSKSNTLHVMLSGWYTENGKNGIYLVVEDSKADKNEVWASCQKYGCDEIEKKEDLNEIGLGFEYYYIPSTGEKGKIATTIGGYAKPVLYLYPEKETNVTITFDKENNLTTTYPKYNGSWIVNAHPNGDLYDKNNKYYYGLYWEEKENHVVDFNEGFYVSKDNAIEFLEEKLTYLGLNDRERNEFIMYWLPILEKNEHNLVYFEQTDERDTYSKINITPKPDSILRIAIHVKKVNGKVNIKEQKLNTFNRTGFTAVEWGGIKY